MQIRFNIAWFILIAASGVFALLYLWYTLFPGNVAGETLLYFSVDQVNRGREYSLMLRLLFIGSFIAEFAFLIWLVFGDQGAALSRWAQSAAGGYWGGVLLFFASLWGLLQIITLPFAIYGSYYWQHRWGFSTQSLGGWWIDYLKGAGLELAITSVGVLLFFWLINRWSNWWLAGAVLFSLWLILQSFLWPVLVSPLFNRFEPVQDKEVLSMVRDLSQKVQLPVDQVLVMDASQRTTKANAYFTGLGRTKRIVLYDTLLEKYPPGEIKAVVAHEMAHWRQGHIIKGLAMGILGNFILWGLLYFILNTTIPVYGRFPPVTWAVLLLFFLLVSFTSSPIQNYISRNMEVEADRIAVNLTGDIPSAVQLQVDLSTRNMSDVSPPPFIRWFSYSHPPATERIANAIKVNPPGIPGGLR